MEIFLVGGAVRDTLLRYPFHEKDWVVVGATPEQLIAQGYTPVGKDFPVFLHPKTKEEYALARTERKSGHGYTGFQCYSNPDVTLEEDLLRRDLTINAIAKNNDGELIDPYHGQQDIKDKVLRHVSNAFTEDPLRVLRVARFYARYRHLGFSIAEETLALMKAITKSGELQHLPAERIWKEFEKALSEQSPDAFLEALNSAEALPILLPAFYPLQPEILNDLKQAAEHALPVNGRFACLFADIDEQQARRQTQQLKVPNHFSELALLISRFSRSHCEGNLSAIEQVRLFEQLDAFRREDRLLEFFRCCDVLSNHSSTIQALRSSFAVIKSVNAKKYVQQGITGKAIAEAIRLERQQIIESLNS